MGPEASVYVYNQGKEDYAVNFAQLTQRDGSFLMGREKADFPDADLEVLTALVERYRAQDTWKPDLILTEEGLNHMMDIIDQAIGLDNRAPYEKIVATEFAEKSMK